MKAFVNVYLCEEHRLEAIEEYGLHPEYFLDLKEIKDDWYREYYKKRLERNICSIQGCKGDPIVSDYLTLRIRDWK